MTGDRWPEVEGLCAAALEHDPDARAAFLDEACAGDTELRREVESLLAGQAIADAVFAVPAIEAVAKAITDRPEALQTGADVPDGLEWPSGERLARGTFLGPYEIEALLDAGGMGDVYRALDTRLGRAVAIKVLPQEVAADPDRLQRFEFEARTVAALNHPNILAIFDVGVSPATPAGAVGVPDRAGGLPTHYLVTELLEGETLRERIAQGPLPFARALDIALPVARALAAAHEKHIVHRDLKPSNVFLTTGGQVKLLDFGIAKVLRPAAPDGPGRMAAGHPRKETTARLGTVGYMSPEQVMGLPTDARSDIFSFGTVLYEMLTARRAFGVGAAGDTPSAVVTNDAPSMTEYRDGAPAGLRSIIARCLAKRPDDRFQSADELTKELAALAVARDGPRRPRRVLWAAGAALLIAVGAGGVLYVQQRGQRLTAPEPGATISRHPRTTIAVLPLQNLSSDPAQAYFAGGVHDELITQLSKAASLRVIGRSSVMGYRATTMPLGRVADELGAGTVVEGSVEVTGGQLHVRLNIVDTATRLLLRTVDDRGAPGDAFAIQSRIAQTVVAAVGGAISKDELARIAQAPTANAEAYRLYLQGKDYQNRPGYLRTNWKASQQLFERALALDPAFALAHAALSVTHGMRSGFRWDTSPEGAALQRQHAETALRLAPDLPQAHVAMALVYRAERDNRRALEEFAVALEQLPNDSEMVSWIAYLNRRLGHWDELFAWYEKAILLNPRDVDLFWDLGGESFALTHRYPQAIAAYDWALALAPDLHYAAIRRGLAWFLWRGDLKPLHDAVDGLPENSDLGVGASVAAQRAALLLLERDAAGLLRMAEVRKDKDFDGQLFFVPSALYAAWAHRLRGEGGEARAAFRAAALRLDAAVRELPGDWRVHAARGLAMAGLGRRDQARAEASWLQHSDFYRADGTFGSMAAEARAQILAQSGEADAALDEIERLLPGPSWLSVHSLSCDPRWDPIRSHPRFQALLLKYGS